MIKTDGKPTIAWYDVPEPIPTMTDSERGYIREREIEELDILLRDHEFKMAELRGTGFEPWHK